MLKIARDAYRAIGAEGFARVDFLVRGDDDLPVRDQHDPGLHADQPVPDDARRGRLHFADVCARVVDLALERHAARAGGASSASDLPR